MPIDYSIYLVTDRDILKGRDISKAVEASIKGGATLIQLREKDISSLDFYNLALKIKEITKYYQIPFIINDRLDIALAVDADGLHIGQQDLPLQITRRLLGDHKILGYSATTKKEAIFGEEIGADYLGVGPIYPTCSKLDAVNPIGIEKLKEIKKSVNIPIVGIGGIGLSNMNELKVTNIDGISVISAILGNENIEEATRNLKNLWKK